MAKSIPAKVTPSLLVWARQRAGYDLEAAAKKTGTTPETVAEWESGESRPTLRQARLLAELYKRPIAIFFLPEPPRGFDVLKEYRRIAERALNSESPELRWALRQAEYRREAALELLDDMDEKVVAVEAKARITEDPEDVGSRLRHWLGVTIEEQRLWKTAYEGLAAWRAALERRDLLVFQMTGVDMEEARGAVIPTRVLPAILLNSTDAPQGRIFTMLHEAAHLWLLYGGYEVKPADRKKPLPRQPAEVFCNAVAGAALLPAEALRHEPEVARLAHSADLRSYKTLANRYSVSPEVVARRLERLGVISMPEYASIREELMEAASKMKGSSGGRVPYDVRILSQLGRRYTTMVLDAYHASAITGSRASDYLGMKLQHLPKLESRLYGDSPRRVSDFVLEA